MQAFTQHCGIAAPMLRPNIDTDAIIPSREMKLVSKKGLGEGLFASWRYTLPGGRETNANFVLNQSAYLGCSILLAGSNFGCGSSREHAVWALTEYGIRAIIAPSFGSIFFNNCIANGLLPVVLAEDTISAIAHWVEKNPQRNQVNIQLSDNTLIWAGQCLDFALDADAREMLLNGLDRIDITLTRTAAINQFERADRQRRPWAYLPRRHTQAIEKV
jgi:3-isopropylmalate/(R)-2-methylmalate dehydratase small subunit